MNELKLLCSYEEWKNRANMGWYSNSLLGMSDNMPELISLLVNNAKGHRNDSELNESQEKYKQDKANTKFTKLTHEITDLYNELKSTKGGDKQLIYVKMAKKQCEIEMLKEKV